MNKMLTLFFSGCALIGLGLGITAVELQGWKVVDFDPAIMEMPVETYAETIDFDTSTSQNVEINYSQPHYGEKTIPVKKDNKLENKIKIEVEYRGAIPDIHAGIYGMEDDEYHSIWVSTYNTRNNEFDFFEICKSMFENKTYYRYDRNTYIENVTIYTSAPENINLLGVNAVMY